MYNCPYLQEIDLNFNAVTTIGQFFLGSCTSLREVDMSKMTAVETIGNGCLYKCSGVETLDISGFNNLQQINGIFCTGVSNLTKVNFGDITLNNMSKALPAYSLTCSSSDDISFTQGILLEGTWVAEFIKYLPKIDDESHPYFSNCYINK